MNGEQYIIKRDVKRRPSIKMVKSLISNEDKSGLIAGYTFYLTIDTRETSQELYIHLSQEEYDRIKNGEEVFFKGPIETGNCDKEGISLSPYVREQLEVPGMENYFDFLVNTDIEIHKGDEFQAFGRWYKVITLGNKTKLETDGVPEAVIRFRAILL